MFATRAYRQLSNARQDITGGQADLAHTGVTAMKVAVPRGWRSHQANPWAVDRGRDGVRPLGGVLRSR
jgi:hypothetical protein